MYPTQGLNLTLTLILILTLTLTLVRSPDRRSKIVLTLSLTLTLTLTPALAQYCNPKCGATQTQTVTLFRVLTTDRTPIGAYAGCNLDRCWASCFLSVTF